MLDTNDIRFKFAHGRMVKQDEVIALCDEIDRLRGESLRSAIDCTPEQDAIEARCSDLEYALVEISNLPDRDSYMCRQIARDALTTPLTDEVQP